LTDNKAVGIHVAKIFGIIEETEKKLKRFLVIFEFHAGSDD